MESALESGGSAVAIVADSLERLIRAPDVQRPIRDGNLTLATPFQPSAGFQVGNAMARNKLIYGLASYAIVVSSSADSGGTRAGALENLRAGWTPLFVRSGPATPLGNDDLVRRGGIPLPPDQLPRNGNFGEWLKEQHGQVEASVNGKLTPEEHRGAAPPMTRRKLSARQGVLFADDDRVAHDA
jgi:predicted Rossmann fold nucleotide-binding protein DprA/Smf involved in DNA uptake